MLEKQLLAILSDPIAYKRYHPLITKDLVTKEVYEIITKGLNFWFTNNPSTPVDWASLSEYCLLTYFSAESLAQKEIYRAAMDSPVAGASGEAIVNALNERLHFGNIAVMAEDIAEGLGTYSAEDVRDEIDLHFKAAPTTKVTALSPQDLDDSSSAGSGLSWGLGELNVSVGDVSIGNLILVAARTEAGKTTFLVHETAAMMKQLSEDHPAIFITNEDPIKSIRSRFLQNLYDATQADVSANLADYKARFEVDYGEKLLLVENASEGARSWNDVVALCEAYNPGLLVIDQLRNVRGFEKEGTEINRLARLFSSCRDLAKDYCPIMVGHQADASTVGVMYPVAHQLEGSKTEVQGALDVQIMLGVHDSPGYEHVRGINVVKNKCGAGPKADPGRRHGKFEVRIIPEKQQFRGSL